MPPLHRMMQFPFSLSPREVYILCVPNALKKTIAITQGILACVVCITYHSSKRVMKQMLGSKVNSVMDVA